MPTDRSANEGMLLPTVSIDRVDELPEAIPGCLADKQEAGKTGNMYPH